MNNSAAKEHLFISYATENKKFAEWLALRLTAEGYKVWCDHTHLLGGESYPDDIDDAIKNRTFRLLALLSHASLHKPNPRKERTLALNIARERKVDFLIPLNVDGLSATELDWMTSDLTFIPFHANWALGFAQLLKKLKAIDAPQSLEAGQARVCDWMAINAQPAPRDERLWVNVLSVTEVPLALCKFELQKTVILPKLAEHWPFFNPTRSRIVWAFGAPDDKSSVPLRHVVTLPWKDVPEFDGLRTEDLALAILRKAITVRCLQKGMKLVPGSGLLYYPEGLLPENHLRFTSYEGKKTYVTATGERTFTSGEQRQRIRYHLAPGFRLTGELEQLVTRVSIHLHLTDVMGCPLEGSKIVSRRKRICKNWWNHEWISRFMAVVEWLCDGHAECEVLSTAEGSFRIASDAMILLAKKGIDESALKPVAAAETITTVIDEDADDPDDFREYDESEEESADE